MKKCILSAIGGAVTMLAALIIITNNSVAKEWVQETKEYEHIDFVSSISQEECLACRIGSDTLASLYWDQDNVGILCCRDLRPYMK